MATIAYFIETGMELFVVGHEYGHFVLDHLNKSHLAEDELEADAVGLDLMLSATRRFSPAPLNFRGAHLLLCSQDLVERAVNVVRTGRDGRPDWKGRTHPPTAARREQLRARVGKLLSPEESNIGAALADTDEFMINVFFDELKPRLLEFHRRQRRLDPMWYGGQD